jgi:hypothetical protein
MPGTIRVEGTQGIEFERLNFASTVSVTASERVRFNNCRFFAEDSALQASRCAGLTITHSEFTRFTHAGVLLDGCTGVELSSNVYDNRQAPAVAFRTAAEPAATLRYSDYNSYADTGKAWMADGRPISLADARKTSQDVYSREARPVASAREQHGSRRQRGTSKRDPRGRHAWARQNSSGHVARVYAAGREKLL